MKVLLPEMKHIFMLIVSDNLIILDFFTSTRYIDHLVEESKNIILKTWKASIKLYRTGRHISIAEKKCDSVQYRFEITLKKTSNYLHSRMYMSIIISSRGRYSYILSHAGKVIQYIIFQTLFSYCQKPLLTISLNYFFSPDSFHSFSH